MNRLKTFNIIISILFTLIAISIFVVLIMGYVFISDHQSDLEEINYRISKSDEAENNLYLLNQRYNEIKDKLPLVNIALPDEKDSSLLVSDLESLSSSAGLKLVLIKSAITGSKKVTTDLSLLQTIKSRYGYEMPIEIKVEGNFSSFSNFIQKIESYQRLINITSIEITKINITGDKSDRIEAKIKLTAYLKK